MIASIPISVTLVSYAATLVVFVAVDMIWLGAMVSRLYRPILGDILAGSVNLKAALAFYALYPLGLVIFAIAPALKAQSLAIAIAYGALFGFFTYATYDLSSQATLRNWSLELTLVDVGWGTVLGATSSAVAFLVVVRLLDLF